MAFLKMQRAYNRNNAFVQCLKIFRSGPVKNIVVAMVYKKIMIWTKMSVNRGTDQVELREIAT